jgi:hypothetical protein
VLFLLPRFVLPVLIAAVKHDDSPAAIAAWQPSLPASTPDGDQRFLHALQQEGLHVGVGQTDSEAIQLGHAICRQLDSGQTVQQQEQSAVDAGLSAQGAHEFVVISVLNYCSEHEKQVTSPQTTPPQVPAGNA